MRTRDQFSNGVKVTVKGIVKLCTLSLVTTIILLIVCKTVSANTNNTSTPIKVACVGNSITFGHAIFDRANNTYPQQLQNMLGDNFNVKNFGVSGRTLLHNGDRPYIETKQYNSALKFSPDILIILLGTNDSKKRNRDKLNNFEADYKDLIDNFKKQNGDVRVIAMLPLPSFGEDSVKIWNPTIKEKIIPHIQAVAYREQVEVIDLYQLFIDKNSRAYMPDKVHPTSLGAAVIAQRLHETLMLTADSEEPTLNIDSDFKIDIDKASSSSKPFNFYGFQGSNFNYEGLSLKVVEPKRALQERPWVLRARFWGHEPQTDIAMLERGFHIVYCEVGALFGSEEAVERWNRCYRYITEKGLSKKVVIEAMSRGGLIAYNWAKENKGKVAAIYADAPVLDGRSWPGGFENGKGSPSDWKLLKQHYNIESDEQSESFKGWPIHYAKQFAKSGIQMLHVCGESDKVVPIDENTKLFEQQILNYGGEITTIYKPEIGHHPHSLKNPTPIVDFILRATNYKLNTAAKAAPSAEFRSAAGWTKGKGWWQQAEQIDSLCVAYTPKDKSKHGVDILLIGNSITQGWGGPRSWVSYKPGTAAAEKSFEGLSWIGAGISGDRTEHIAWRVESGHYGACNPAFVVLTIGVNNFSRNSASEIVDGIMLDLDLIKREMPNSEILLLGPLPTGIDPDSDQRTKFREIHAQLAKIRFSKQVHYSNLERLFCNSDNYLNLKYMGGDGIHLKPQGYTVWGEYIKREIEKKRL